MEKTSTFLILNPNWVTGFSDAESTFSISIRPPEKNTNVLGVVFSYRIELHPRDLNTLLSIQNFFNGIGHIKFGISKKTVSFTVNHRKDLIQIFKHFDSYPLESYKLRNYILFKEVYNLVNDKKITEEKDILHIVSIVNNINKPLSKKLRLIYPVLNDVILPELPAKSELNPYWVTGFTDGDACFNIRERISSKRLETLFYNFRYQVTLHADDNFTIENIKVFFKVGKTYHRKFSTFTCETIQDIKSIIIPHFEKYPLLSAKSNDYIIFKKVFDLVDLKPEGYKEKIKELLKLMNSY